MDLKEQQILGDDISQHWYYHAKAAALIKFTSSLRTYRILDVGAGSGFFAKTMLRQGEAIEAQCVDPNYPGDHEEICHDKPLYFVRQTQGYEPDLIMMMDVLEHVDDDLALLRSYVDAAPPGCHFLITVPAFSFLWSAHDEFLGHRRRYTLRETETLLEQAGLSLNHGAYFFGFVFPLALISRMAGKLLGNADRKPQSQLKHHSPIVNAVLKAISMAELKILRFNRIGGLSVFCLARKP